MGAAAAVVAPRRSLVALARGLDRPAGLWSVARDPVSGGLVGLVPAGVGTELRTLTVDADGGLRIGRPLLSTPAGVSALAVGVDQRGPLVLGAGTVTIPATPALPHPADTAVQQALRGEPHGPANLPRPTTERLIPVVLHTDGRVVEGTSSRLVTAALGSWTLLQHGPDEEADHLPTVTVRAGGEERVLADALHLPGTAALGGPAGAPVAAVSDGEGSVRVHSLVDGIATTVADDPVVAVASDGRNVLASVGGRGQPVALQVFDGTHWRTDRVLPGTEGTTEVLPVAGAAAMVLVGRDGCRYVDLEARD